MYSVSYMYLPCEHVRVTCLPLQSSSDIMYVHVTYLREQEEESIRAAIALSQAEAEKGDAEENEEEKEEDRNDNLLLDLNSSGV